MKIFTKGTGMFRVSAINTFLYVAVPFLICLILNLYGAVMIGHFIHTQKSLTAKHADQEHAPGSKHSGAIHSAAYGNRPTGGRAHYGHPPWWGVSHYKRGKPAVGAASPFLDFVNSKQCSSIDKCREKQVGCMSPLFSLPDRVARSDHGKSAKGVGELARETSLALDSCKALARNGSRMPSRAGTGSISWAVDRHGGHSSSYISMPPGKPQMKGLMNETAFDRAVEEHGLPSPVDNGAHAAAAAFSTGQAGQEARSVPNTRKATGRVIPGRPFVTTASLAANDLPFVMPLPMGRATKAAVQFAASDQTVLLPASKAGSKAFSSGEDR